MPTLSELQRDTRLAVLGGSSGTAAAAVAPDGLAPDARLAIYRHHVLESLTAVLRDTYPVVCRLVDERFFRYAADAYIRREPPTEPRLFAYGAGFADFLAGFPACRTLPYLPDVARLEWALHVAYHAEDAATPDGPELAGLLAVALPEELGRLVFTFHPSVRYLTSPYPVEAIWRANQGAGDGRADLDAGGAYLEIRRVEDDATLRALSEAEWTLRAALAAGRPLDEAGGAALAIDGGFDLAAAIAALLSEGLLTRVTFMEGTTTC